MLNNWKSLGLLIKTPKKFNWLKSHMWVPVADNIDDKYVNVYFSSRNKQNFSSTGVFKFDPENIFKKIKINHKPVIELGNLGLFDDSAAIACTLVNYKKKNIYIMSVGCKVKEYVIILQLDYLYQIKIMTLKKFLKLL